MEDAADSEPFDPIWLTPSLRGSIAATDALLLLGSLIGLTSFYRSRQLPLAHWRGVPGKVRFLLAALFCFSIFQTAADGALLSYKVGQHVVLGAYVVLGVAATACYAATVILVTFLALHSHRGFRWGIGFAIGAQFFLFSIVSVAYPGLNRTRGGFFTAWLPYTIDLASWCAIFVFVTRASSWGGDVGKSLFSTLPMHPTSTHHFSLSHLTGLLGSSDITLDQDIKIRISWVAHGYLFLGIFIMIIGLGLEQDEGRTVMGVLLSALYRLMWPLHVWGLGIGLEATWGYEWVRRLYIHTSFVATLQTLTHHRPSFHRWATAR